MLVAVLFAVSATRLLVVFLCVRSMPVRDVGVVRRLLVITRFMMLRGFRVVLGSMLMVFGCFLVMFDGRF